VPGVLLAFLEDAEIIDIFLSSKFDFSEIV